MQPTRTFPAVGVTKVGPGVGARLVVDAAGNAKVPASLEQTPTWPRGIVTATTAPGRLSVRWEGATTRGMSVPFGAEVVNPKRPRCSASVATSTRSAFPARTSLLRGGASSPGSSPPSGPRSGGVLAGADPWHPHAAWGQLQGWYSDGHDRRRPSYRAPGRRAFGSQVSGRPIRFLFRPLRGSSHAARADRHEALPPAASGALVSRPGCRPPIT